MIAVHCDRPWLQVRLPQPMPVLSWAPLGGGRQVADSVLWREVRDADLTRDFDAVAWLGAQVAARDEAGAVAFLTSRDVRRFVMRDCTVDGVGVACVATVGLTNAERIGQRLGAPILSHGTINILAVTDQGLTLPAQIEAVTIVAQARTAAMLDAAPAIATGQPTGTGTDCIAIAAPEGPGAYAGLHTALGEALGRATYDAVHDGIRAWRQEAGA